MTLGDSLRKNGGRLRLWSSEGWDVSSLGGKESILTGSYSISIRDGC